METSLPCPPAIRDAVASARTRLEALGAGSELVQAAEAAGIIGGLTENTELALALLAHAALAAGSLTSEQCTAALGQSSAQITAALVRLGNLAARDWSPERGLDTRQTQTPQDAAGRGQRPAPGTRTARRGTVALRHVCHLSARSARRALRRAPSMRPR
jgi:hypothetical protein